MAGVGGRGGWWRRARRKEMSDHPTKFSEIERLRKMLVHSGIEAVRPDIRGDRRGDAEDQRALGRRLGGPNPAGGCVAIDARHVDVHEDDVEAMLGGELDGLFAAIGELYVEAVSAKKHLENQPVGGNIIDDQNLRFMAGGECLVAAGKDFCRVRHGGVPLGGDSGEMHGNGSDGMLRCHPQGRQRKDVRTEYLAKSLHGSTWCYAFAAALRPRCRLVCISFRIGDAEQFLWRIETVRLDQRLVTPLRHEGIDRR